MRVDLRLSIEVPDGTDPELVREVIDAEFEYAAAGGGPCNWRRLGWVPAPAEVPGSLQPGETRYSAAGGSIHRHVKSGPCPCGQVIPFCGVAGHPDGAHGGHPG